MTEKIVERGCKFEQGQWGLEILEKTLNVQVIKWKIPEVKNGDDGF